jgi:hypothetical protein
MTTVRMNVAKSELTLSTPTFAKMAVNAANTAESAAHNCQDIRADRMIDTSRQLQRSCAYRPFFVTLPCTLHGGNVRQEAATGVAVEAR